MNSARETILKKIRATQGDSQSNPLPELIRPAINSDHVAQFREKLELGGGSLDQVKDYSAAASLITDFLIVKNLPMRLRLAPALKQIRWVDQVEVSYGKSDGDDLVSVTPAFCAIAETGSVILLSGPDSPTTLNFLPDYHFVIVEISQLVAHIEDGWAKLRQQNNIPRTINMITGPSKTADVEQTLQIGAHGPRQLRVIFVDRA